MDWGTPIETYADGHRCPVGALADKTLLESFNRYKRSVAKRYRIVEPPLMSVQLPATPLWLSPKLDGELWFLVKRGDQLALATVNGRVLQGIAVCREAQAALKDAPDLIIPGELTVDKEGGRARVQDVAVAFNDPNLADRLRFSAFDILELGADQPQTWPYEQRLQRLRDWFGRGAMATVVPTVSGDSAEAAARYREWVEQGGHEGVVARAEQATYKVKPTFTIDAVVIAFGERLEGERTELREMVVGLLRDDGAYQILGSVGNGFSAEDRLRWHGRLSAIAAPSAFRLANREGTLCRFVRPEIIIEIRCSDLLLSDGFDQAIRRMALSYTLNDGWQPRHPGRIAAMIFPVFVRERDDKVVDPGHVGMTQITSRVTLEESGGPQAELGAAETLERRVWTKDNKGNLAVRKYVLLATHKEQDRNYPAYVAFFTDYSPGRAEPLQTSLKVASNRQRAQRHCDQWIEENIKKGWVEVLN